MINNITLIFKLFLKKSIIIHKISHPCIKKVEGYYKVKKLRNWSKLLELRPLERQLVLAT